MRTSVFLTTVALLLGASTAFAQYGTSPAQPFLDPENPKAFGQIDFGGRISSMEGDEARYQRYRDLRDGFFFDLTGIHREWGATLFDASVTNLGWRDQRYQAELQQPGRFRFRFLYDQTPMFISRDTRTPYDPLPSGLAASTTLSLPDSLQAAIQANPSAQFRPLIEAAAGNRYFDTRIRRDTLGVDLRYSVGDVDAKFAYQNTRKQGTIPFGAYLNIPIELPLPIDSRANDVRTSIEWATAKGLLSAGWDGSWFDNRAEVVTWDNPQYATNLSNRSSQGRLPTWPSNTMFTFNVAGAYRLPSRTTVNGVVAVGQWNQDATLLPFTLNPAVSYLPSLSRTTAQGEATTSTVLLNLTSRPAPYLDLSARYRFYDFDNKTPPFIVARTDGNPDRVSADTSAGTWSDPSIGKIGSEPFGYRRNYFDLDAGISGVPNTTFRVGYGRYAADTHYRVYEEVAENTFRLGADVIGTQYLSLRSQYERSQRRGGHLEPHALEFAEEQPGMRHYDIASRDRDRFTALASLTPAATLGINASVAWTKDTYLNEATSADRFGLLEYTSRTYTAGLDFSPRDGLGAGLSVSVEDYDGLQQSRSASPTVAGQLEDPTRNWTLDEGNKALSVIASLDVLKAIEKTELRFSFNYTDYTGSYRHRLAANSPLNQPLLLPDIASTETRSSVDLRYFLSKRVALGLVYWFDKYDVEDFSLSPDIVSGVAQPPVEEGQTGTVNALMLNYFYRPFRAHTVWLRLSYLF